MSGKPFVSFGKKFFGDRAKVGDEASETIYTTSTNVARHVLIQALRQLGKSCILRLGNCREARHLQQRYIARGWISRRKDAQRSKKISARWNGPPTLSDRRGRMPRPRNGV